MDKIKEVYGVDIKENFIKHLDEDILDILLKDHSSGENIIWATDTYLSHGFGFKSQDQITPILITGRYGCVIKPRTEKSKKEQQHRIKNKAEVFTPSWVCNKQNNLVDNSWFGQEDIFNYETKKGWNATHEKVIFPSASGKTWQDYIKANRLEITCGEAPYLTSRYDAVTGEYIDIKERIGLLDRKLRIVSENNDSESEWYDWALTAIKSVYGFDYQGDNVLIARENLLFSFIDAYIDKFKVPPVNDYLKEVANILSWNIWQMDGLRFVIPNSCKSYCSVQISIFDSGRESCCPGCQKNDPYQHTGIYCKIMNWDTGEPELFIDQLRKKKE